MLYRRELTILNAQCRPGVGVDAATRQGDRAASRLLATITIARGGSQLSTRAGVSDYDHAEQGAWGGPLTASSFLAEVCLLTLALVLPLSPVLMGIGVQ